MQEEWCVLSYAHTKVRPSLSRLLDRQERRLSCTYGVDMGINVEATPTRLKMLLGKEINRQARPVKEWSKGSFTDWTYLLRVKSVCPVRVHWPVRTLHVRAPGKTEIIPKKSNIQQSLSR